MNITYMSNFTRARLNCLISSSSFILPLTSASYRLSLINVIFISARACTKGIPKIRDGSRASVFSDNCRDI